jgi:signal transduction histidine kinase
VRSEQSPGGDPAWGEAPLPQTVLIRHRRLAALLALPMTVLAMALMLWNAVDMAVPSPPVSPPGGVVAERLERLLDGQMTVARLVAAMWRDKTTWDANAARLGDLIDHDRRIGNILVVDGDGHLLFSARPYPAEEPLPTLRPISASGPPAALLLRPGAILASRLNLMGVAVLLGTHDERRDGAVEVLGPMDLAGMAPSAPWLLIDDDALKTSETTDRLHGVLPPEAAGELRAAVAAGLPAGDLAGRDGKGWHFQHLDRWAVSALSVDGGAAQRAIDWRIEAAFALLALVVGLTGYSVFARARPPSAAVLLAHAEQRVRFIARSDDTSERLAGAVAHEVNNLLTVISMDTEMIADRCEEDAVTGELTSSILASVTRANGITSRLLAFAGRQTLQPRALDAASELTRLKPVLVGLLASRQSLVVRPSPPALVVRMDPEALEICLAELVRNAVAASDIDGVIELGAALDQAGARVALTVSDEGTGMLPAILRRACEPFFTARREPGLRDPGGARRPLGLGLSRASGLARQSGGLLTLESRPGWGTVAGLLLPLAGQAPSDSVAPPLPVATVPDAAPRVLVVDDDETLRASLSRRLHHDGFEVLEAATPSEALSLAATGIDLLITDVVLHDAMDGVSLALRIRAGHPLLPLVFISGFMSARLPELLANDELTCFLRKPINGAELTAVLGGLLALRSYRGRQPGG